MIEQDMNLIGKKVMDIKVSVATPIVVGQDDKNGRRQLIPITSGVVDGTDLHGSLLRGEVCMGGVDSQIIRPDGTCQLSARYGIKLSDGRSFYIENNGIRTVPKAYVNKVLKGEFIDPKLYYFCTRPEFEVYDDSLRWLEKNLFICKASRLSDMVILEIFMIN